jgi:hypothetical protein
MVQYQSNTTPQPIDMKMNKIQHYFSMMLVVASTFFQTAINIQSPVSTCFVPLLSWVHYYLSSSCYDRQSHYCDLAHQSH